MALVLSGSYEEIGDTGSWAVAPGDVIVHSPFEAHYNGIGTRGAEVLLMPIQSFRKHALLALDDPDEAVRLSQKSPEVAAAYVLKNARNRASNVRDWPDLLAQAIREEPDLQITQWALGIGLDPAVVSRGFRRHFDCSPSQYRLKSRVRAALPAIASNEGTLGDIAHDCGFSDQAHFSRAIRSATGLSPTGLRAFFEERAHKCMGTTHTA
ncbi:AraC family transcriptional regulator [uncultured Erythrobacter sp.]|nr:AraC family transcriptional regulator [uncultured Erythrobacter sp.]